MSSSSASSLSSGPSSSSSSSSNSSLLLSDATLTQTRDTDTESASSQSSQTTGLTSSSNPSMQSTSNSFATNLANSSSSQSGSINSIMNYIYPSSSSSSSINQSHSATSSNNSILETSSSSNMSVMAAAVSRASATLAAGNEEPELKKVKLTHNFNFLFSENAMKQQQQQFASRQLTASNIGDNSASVYMVHKKLEERIGGILCCTVCLDLPQTIIYQCTNGHLMCAGCFSHLLADARLKDEQATCPNCRCEISKTSCSRNLAVEKTLSELPASCTYCNAMLSRNYLEQHQRNECMERPSKCIYKRIGCTWEGPYHELNEHSEQCTHPNRPCREIIGFLQEKDAEIEDEHQAIYSLINYLSFEKVCFNDLQFKQYKTDEITPKLYFETNRFGAFFHQWVLKARVNDNQKNPNLSLNRFISYQLILKSRLTGTQPSVEVKFCFLKGPFGEVPINARVQTFEFNQNKLETDYIKLDIKSTDCNKLLASKIINFRFFMFQA